MTHAQDLTTQIKALIGPTLPTGTHEIRAVAIQTINSSATLDGLSGTLGNPLDQALLSELRAWSDAILVTGATALAEQYQPVALSPAQQRDRTSSGRASLPMLVVWDRSGRNVKSLMPLLSDEHSILLTQNSTAAQGLDVANPPIVYQGGIQMAVQAVRERLQAARVIVEGGPHLYSAMLEAGLVEKLHLTIAPVIVSPGTSLFPSSQHSTVHAEHTRNFKLETSITTEDGLIFCRYAKQS